VQILSKLPRWALFLLIAAAYTVIMSGQAMLTGKELEPVRLLVTSGMGLVVAAGALWLIKRQRAREAKKPIGYPTASNFREAASSGRLPEGARAELWIPELVRTIEQERIMAWLGPILFGAFAAMGVFLIFENPDLPWLWVICTLFFAGLAVGFPVWIPRRRRRMAALIAELEVSGEEGGAAS